MSYRYHSRIEKKLDDTSTQLGAEAFVYAHALYSVTNTLLAEAASRTALGDLARRYDGRCYIGPTGTSS